MIIEFSVVPVGRSEAGRVVTHIAIDDRTGASGRLAGKVREVERTLGRTLKK